jgi:lysozyme
VACLASVLLTVRAADPAEAAPARTPGIDVSRWQDDIDWPKVAATDVEFVIMKATEGSKYEDPTYVTNLAGATAARLSVGSYHVATPKDTAADPVAEADHFVATARNAVGDVLPVLDIEHTGGLKVSQLQDWVQAWVMRVKARTGVRPMIYASPYFWRTYLGDSRWFADHGYPLWIANWKVNEPDVPAANWGGEGWTFWQWTSEGRVHGITTNVDRDHFHGADLRNGQIARLTVHNGGGGRVTGERIECRPDGSGCARLTNPGDPVTLTATPAAGATLLRWTGACAAAGSAPTCTVTVRGRVSATAVFGYAVDVAVKGTGGGTVTSSPSGIDCGADCSADLPFGTNLTLTESPDSASGFGAWGGDCGGSASTCTLSVTSPVSVSARFDAAVTLDEDGVGTRYAWGRKVDRRALGGSYVMDRRAGATQTFGFRGGAVTLFTVSGPAMGKASVLIDGVPVSTFDGYARSLHAGVEHRLGGLGSGAHTLAVRVLGTKVARAKGTGVTVDAMRANGSLHVNPKPSGGTWGRVASPDATNGGYVLNDVADAAATLRFHGTGATWITVRGPAMGVAQIWMDGKLRKTVDLYAATRVFGAERTIDGLADRSHVLRVVVLGAHRKVSAGSSVAVDGWIVR